jgi:hypothetical protein
VRLPRHEVLRRVEGHAVVVEEAAPIHPVGAAVLARRLGAVSLARRIELDGAVRDHDVAVVRVHDRAIGSDARDGVREERSGRRSDEDGERC